MNKVKYLGLDKINSSRFIKEFSKDNHRLNELEKDLKTASPQQQYEIRGNINKIKQGIEGEEQVHFELKNSSLPMLCLHNSRIKSKDYVTNEKDMYSQIDFIVITNKFICVLETKNLVGDIEINENGDFIRITKDFNTSQIKREGMYNPLSQGKRHANAIKNLLNKSSLLKGLPEFPIINIAVMANHKNIINKNNAPESVKSNIYRCDQILNFLEQELLNDKYEFILSDSKIQAIANYIKDNDEPIVVIDEDEERIRKELTQLRKDTYKRKKIYAYNVFKDATRDSLIDKKPKTLNELKKFELDSWVIEEIGEAILKIVNGGSGNSNITQRVSVKQMNYLESKLREYREKMSSQNNEPLYSIFDNNELARLIEIRPKNIEELFEIKGFSKANKLNKYGKDILNIINEKK